jgi:hypothetical protein
MKAAVTTATAINIMIMEGKCAPSRTIVRLDTAWRIIKNFL